MLKIEHGYIKNALTVNILHNIIAFALFDTSFIFASFPSCSTAGGRILVSALASVVEEHLPVHHRAGCLVLAEVHLFGGGEERMGKGGTTNMTQEEVCYYIDEIKIKKTTK